MRYALHEARDWVRHALRGYLTVLYTPFDESGALDEEGLRHNVRATLALPGVGGLSVHSLHQEFWTLEDAERMRLVEIVIDEVGGIAPVVVGCSDPSAHRAVRFAQHAAAVGADAVMIWPPFYGPRSAEGVRDFYEFVAARVAIGFFAYSTTLSELGYHLTPPEVATLLNIPHLCGVQNTTLSVAQYAAMLDEVGASVTVATSLEEYHLHGHLAFPDRAPRFLIGASRPVFCQNARHPHAARFLAALTEGDFLAAAAHARTIGRIADQLQSRYFARGFHHVALFKHLAGRMGMRTGPVRPGIAPASASEINECEAVLVRAGLLDPGLGKGDEC